MSAIPPELDAILEGAEIPGEPAPAADLAPAPEAVAEPTAPELPADPSSDPDWFDRKYVEELRQENARYRQRAQTFEQAFDGYEEEDRQFLLGVAQGLRSEDPATRARAAVLMQQAADGVLGSTGGFDEPEPQYLTEAQLTAILDSREAKRIEQDTVRSLFDQAKALGYNVDDDGDADTLVLMGLTHKHGGDINAAHQALEARKQQIIDAYLASKTAEAEGSPTLAPPMGTAPSGENRITTFSQASQALLDSLG